MKDLVELTYEYRRLLACSQLLPRIPASAQARLVALEELFGPEPGPRRRRHARCSVQVPARLLRDGGESYPVEITSLGGGGMSIRGAAQAKLDGPSTLEVQDERGRVYAFPVRSGWTRTEGAVQELGLPFRGSPRRV